ncbi:SET domain-containing protein [bacterium]|nr:SET domain-containing protein [bacterium]
MSCLHVMSAVRNPLLDAIVPTLDDACKADQFGGDFRDYEFVLSDNDRALTHYRNQIPADYWFERRSHPAVPIISKEIGRQLDRCENGGTRSVRTGSSSISGIGVFAGSHLNYGDLIGVYTGKMRRISDVLSDQIKWGHNPYLMFTRPDIDVGILSQFSLLKEWVIDARTTGGICRFINHSNTPNCTVSLGFWRGLIVPVIMVSASGGVPKNEECTISYGNHYGQFLSDRPIDSNF